jgi:hypothetical protein
MEPNAKDTAGLLARLFAKAGDAAQALVESPVETNARRAGMPRYSRRYRHPANAHVPLGPADRVLPSGQVVGPDTQRPFGGLLNDLWESER